MLFRLSSKLDWIYVVIELLFSLDLLSLEIAYTCYH